MLDIVSVSLDGGEMTATARETEAVAE